MKTSIFIILTLLMLTGCDTRQPPVLSPHSSDTYTVIKVRQPKHYHVNIQNNRTGRVYEHAVAVKHCSAWERYPVGSQVTLTRYSYFNGSAEIIDFDHSELYDTFCR